MAESREAATVQPDADVPAEPARATPAHLGTPPPLSSEDLRKRTRIVPANQPVLLRLPSGMTKQVVLEPGKTVSIGKFGSFPADAIIGAQFGPTYEIKADGHVAVMQKEAVEAQGTYLL